MFIRSLIIGAAFTVVLLTVLVGSRLIETEKAKDTILLREVELTTLKSTPPLDVDFDEEKEKVEEASESFSQISESQPASADFSLAVDLSSHSLNGPTTRASPMDYGSSLKVSVFHPDRAPSILPTRLSSKVKTGSKPAKSNGGQSRTATNKGKLKPKAFYAPDELDGRPRELRKGNFRWPSRARGRVGKVKLLIEINTSGQVRVIKVVSSTNSSLNTAATKVAQGSRFSVPKVGGRAVKARFTLTYNLKKPR